MNLAPKSPKDRSLPDWSECDVFCITGYAGSGATACGWRGRRPGARGTSDAATSICPWCGGATLLSIPSDRADRAD